MRQPFRIYDSLFGWFSYPNCPAYWSYHSTVIKMVLWWPWPLVDKVSQRLSAGSAWPNNESSVKLVTVQVYTIYYLLTFTLKKNATIEYVLDLLNHIQRNLFTESFLAPKTKLSKSCFLANREQSTDPFIPQISNLGHQNRRWSQMGCWYWLRRIGLK